MANERTPQQIIGDDAFNQLTFEGYVVTRPAAPVEGLENRGYLWRERDDKSEAAWKYTHRPISFADEVDCDELVTKSQAEAIIAAERAEKERFEELAERRFKDILDWTADFNECNVERARWKERAERAEADNAALTARVKEQEQQRDEYRDKWQSIMEQEKSSRKTYLLHTKALETQLAAARKALEEIANFTQTTDLLWWQERARAALEITHDPH